MASLFSGIASFLDVNCDEEDELLPPSAPLASIMAEVAVRGFEMLVSTLGAHLVDADHPRERGRAVELLAEVLTRSGPSLALTASGVESTSAFFLDRASKADDVSTGGCLQGLLALLTHHEPCATAPTAALVVELVLTGGGGAFYVPSMAQMHRQRAMSILLRVLLVPRFCDAVRSRGAFFVSEFARAMDGEKDPRCLVTCLRVARAALRQFDDAALRETAGTLFEVTSCYFPIMFTPPPNDPHKITREALVELLRDVFTATERMAPHLMPLLLEKTESTSEAVKVDAIETLAACFVDAAGANLFSPAALSPFLPAICEALFREVIEGTAKVVGAALSAIRAISKRAARSIVGVSAADVAPLADTAEQRALLGGFHDALLHRCWSTLEAETSLSSLTSRAAARVLRALIDVSPLTLARAAPSTWAIAIARYNKSSSVGASGDAGEGAAAAERLAVIEITKSMLGALSAEVDFDRACHPIIPILDEIVRVLSASAALSGSSAEGSSAEGSAMETESSSTPSTPSPSTEEQVCAVRGLRCLLERPPSPLLAPDVATAVLEGLTALAVGSSREPVRAAALSAIVAAGGRTPAFAQMLSDRCWPIVSRSLAGALAGGASEPAAVLEAVVALSIPTLPGIFRQALQTLLGTLVPRSGGATLRFAQGIDTSPLLFAMQRIVAAGAVNPELMDECITRWPAVAEADSKQGLRSQSATGGVGGGTDSLVNTLLGALGQTPDGELSPPALASNAALLGELTRSCTAPRQQELLAAVSGLLLQPVAATAIPAPLVSSIVGVVGSVRFEWTTPNLEPLVTRLLELALISEAGAQMLASVLNRLAKGDALNAMVARVSDALLASVAAESRVGGGGAVRALLWVTKGLLMRSHATGSVLAQRLAALVTGVNYVLAAEVAAGFGLVVRDSARVLTKKSGATVRRLYKQRFFGAVFPALCGSIEESTKSLAALPGGSSESDEVATLLIHATRAPLLAIAAMAYGVPTAVALSRIEDLLLLLLRGLGYAAEHEVGDVAASRMLRASALAALHCLYPAIVSLGTDSSSGGEEEGSVTGTQLFARHATTLVTLLLDSARVDSARSQPHAAARMMALTCLSWLATLPFAQVHPLKHTVIKGLAPVIDDSKRAVRRHAVRCRNDWYVKSIRFGD